MSDPLQALGPDVLIRVAALIRERDDWLRQAVAKNLAEIQGVPVEQVDALVHAVFEFARRA